MLRSWRIRLYSVFLIVNISHEKKNSVFISQYFPAFLHYKHYICVNYINIQLTNGSQTYPLSSCSGAFSRITQSSSADGVLFLAIVAALLYQWQCWLISWPTALVQTRISQQLFSDFPWNCVQIFMVSRQKRLKKLDTAVFRRCYSNCSKFFGTITN